jgi:hypothetical protein
MKAEDVIGVCCLLFVTGFAFATVIMCIFHVAKTADQWQETHEEFEEHKQPETIFYVNVFGELEEAYTHLI